MKDQKHLPTGRPVVSHPGRKQADRARPEHSDHPAKGALRPKHRPPTFKDHD